MVGRFHTCILFTLGVFLFLLMPFPLIAANIYVATTGSDSTGTGAIEKPYLTVNKAQSVVACGDTIYIRGGIYAGSNHIGGNPWPYVKCLSYGSGVTIRNYMAEQVILRPGGGVAYTLEFGAYGTDEYYWKVIGNSAGDITVDNTNAQYRNNGTVTAYGGYVWLENLEIKNSWFDGIGGGGFGWTLVNLNVHDNGGASGPGQPRAVQPHGIYWTGSNLLIDGGRWCDNSGGFGIHIFSTGHTNVDDNVVRNAVICNNNATLNSGGGIILASGHRNLAYNNIIFGNQADGLDIDYRCEACAAYNNTIYGNSNNGIGVGNGGGSAPAVDTILKNNLLNSNGGTIANSGIGTVNANNYTGSNPGLTNPEIGNFTLQPLSSAIGAGLNLSSLFTTDFAGKLRAVGKSTFDIGAFEYAPPSTDTIPPQVSISVITP